MKHYGAVPYLTDYGCVKAAFSLCSNFPVHAWNWSITAKACVMDMRSIGPPCWLEPAGRPLVALTDSNTASRLQGPKFAQRSRGDYSDSMARLRYEPLPWKLPESRSCLTGR